MFGSPSGRNYDRPQSNIQNVSENNRVSRKKSFKELTIRLKATWNVLLKIPEILTRVLFAIHGIIALWRVSSDDSRNSRNQVGYLGIGLYCMLLELIFALKKGKECKLYKW